MTVLHAEENSHDSKSAETAHAALPEGHIQSECLDHFIALGAKHLDYLVSQYLTFYHTFRPHQGLENKPILPMPPPSEDVPKLEQVVCHRTLGGLLKHFERRAA